MSNITTSRETWGKWSDGREVHLFTFTKPGGIRVKLTDYGGYLVAVEIPGHSGAFQNIVVGCQRLDGYLQQTAKLGATIGRYANRIANGRFTLDGREYTLPINNGPNHLHGGPHGFSQQMWDAKEVRSADAAGVQLTYVSRDGEEGYPGTLTATATYWLTVRNELRIGYTATTDKKTVVNLTNHAYWNLAGVGSGNIYSHEMTIPAARILDVDSTSIPTGRMLEVKDTLFDFNSPKALGPGIEQFQKTNPHGGYDHCYVLGNPGQMVLAARAKDPSSGRTLEVWTDQPGVQLYTANYLEGRR